MKRIAFYQNLKTALLILLLIACTKGFSQSTNDGNEEDTPRKPAAVKGLKRFQFGIYFGSYFTSDNTAGIYDGYGYDMYGYKNNFDNSFMNQRIVYDYGGGRGAPDYIAQALNVGHTDWSFGQTDMPVNLTYAPALVIGLNTRYMINRRDAILLNVNASQLSINGNFTITINSPTITTQAPNYENYRTFAIKGTEQRLIFQLGYQRLLGDIGKMNFFLEGGFISTLAKYSKEQIMINTLQIDLGYYYNQPGIVSYRPKELNGIGLGGFAGFGLNFSVHPNLTMQLLYSPSYETINIGDNPKPTLQQAIGLRAYGSF